ncbi:mortality factor 4-like protein 1 [Dromiciops gliroides]|uniref:mortality factor 4-like protein 1 n=1 Tax=Dromiciops gliroides TaxID=33562 RepID=UPI001CC4ACFF|nr:mortality factor 4-like protein 1 [Dromiciops gliroides]
MAPKKTPKKRPRKPQFEVGERVLCFRGPLLYEAECVKVSVKYRKVKYLVHYPGGNEKGPMRTRLSEKLAKMEVREKPKAREDDKAHETGEQSEGHKAPKASEVSQTSEAPESHKVRVVCEAREAPQAPDGGTEAHGILEILEATRVLEICEGREVAEVPEYAKAPDATGETRETSKAREKREKRKARKARKAQAMRKAQEEAGAQEPAEDTETREAATACDEAKVSGVRETRMARMIREAREAAAAQKAAAVASELPKNVEVCEAAEASASCETVETSDGRKVSAASKEQAGGKAKAKRKGKGKAKAKTDGDHLPAEDDDFASQDPLCPTAGWDDEWVPESRLLKYSETNLQKQRELFEATQEQSPKGKGDEAASGKKTPEGPEQNPVKDSVEVPSTSKGAKRRNQKPVTETDRSGAGNRDGSSSSEVSQQPHWRRQALVNSDGEPRTGFTRRSDFKINIPTELKPWLVTDWDLVTAQKKLFCLPAKKNVESILEDYELYEKSYANSEEKIYAVPEIVAGIRVYFDVMLGTHLLYKFEKPQHSEILAKNPGVPMSQIYGAPHLLRLFVKIGDVLSCTFFDSHSTNLLLKYLHDFVNYLEKNSAALFSPNDYEPASPEYLQKVAEEPENVGHS